MDHELMIHFKYKRYNIDIIHTCIYFHINFYCNPLVFKKYTCMYIKTLICKTSGAHVFLENDKQTVHSPQDAGWQPFLTILCFSIIYALFHVYQFYMYINRGFRSYI